MKLIRDKMPSIARAKGETIECHTANSAEYQYYLGEKLIEMVHEFLDSGDAEELADLLEVIRAIAKERNIEMSKLYRLRDKKQRQCGGFEGRIILQDNQDINYGGS